MISTYSNVLAFAVNAKMSTKLNVNAAPFVSFSSARFPIPPEPSVEANELALAMENTQLKKRIVELKSANNNLKLLNKTIPDLKNQVFLVEEMGCEIVTLKDTIAQLKNENERLEKEKKHATKSFSATVSSLFEEEDKNTRLEDVILKQTSAILELKAEIENLQKEKDAAIANMNAIQVQLCQKTYGLNDYMAILERSTAEYTRTLAHWLQEKMVLQSTIETFSVVYRAKNAECDQFKTIVEGYERRIKEVQACHGIVSELFVP